jgi:hypothetical protein
VEISKSADEKVEFLKRKERSIFVPQNENMHLKNCVSDKQLARSLWEGLENEQHGRMFTEYLLVMLLCMAERFQNLFSSHRLMFCLSWNEKLPQTWVIKPKRQSKR